MSTRSTNGHSSRSSCAARRRWARRAASGSRTSVGASPSAPRAADCAAVGLLIPCVCGAALAGGAARLALCVVGLGCGLTRPSDSPLRAPPNGAAIQPPQGTLRSLASASHLGLTRLSDGLGALACLLSWVRGRACMGQPDME
eukprot:3035462-Prymnesium_polylepis.1